MPADKSERNWRERRPRSAAHPDHTPERKSWRKRAGVAPGGSVPARSEPVDPRRALYRLRIFGGLLAMVFTMMFVAWIIYLTMTPRQTPLVALHVTSYAPQMELPPNEQAAEDYQRFRQAFLVRSANRGKRVGNVNIGFWEQPGDDGVVQRSTLLDLLVKPLSNNRFRPGGPKKNIVMFYISAHGVVNDRGEPCLLTSDSSATKAAEWLTVEELLKRLLDHPEYGRQSSVKKIVCLDANRLEMHDRIGLLYNSFTMALQRLVTNLEEPNLYVINSASPGERNWSSAQLQGSAFGFFLAEGLNGRADENGNGTVALGELMHYLDTSVGSWTLRRRAVSQQPLLIATDPNWEKVPVAYASRDSESLAQVVERSADQVEKQLKARGRQLRDLTAQYTDLLQQGAYVHSPLQWGRLQRDLTQLDLLLTAGSAYDVQFDEVLNRATSMLKQLRQPRPLPGRNLIAAHNAQPDLNQQTRQRLAVWKAKPNPAEWKERLDHAAATDMTWNWLPEAASAANFQSALELLDRSRPAPNSGPELPEAYFLRILAKFAPIDENADLIRQAMQARGKAEQSATLPDVRAIYWVRQALDEADEQRRAAEDSLLLATPDALEKARQLFSSATAGHQAAEATAAEVAQWLALRDETYALVPAIARWLMVRANYTDDTDDGRKAMETAAQLVSQLHTLAAALEPYREPDRAAAIAQARTAAQQLNATLSNVRRQYVEACQALMSRAGDQKTLRNLYYALTTAVLDPAVDRNALRDRYLTLLFDQREDLRVTDLQDAQESSAAKASKSGEDPLLAAASAPPIHPLLLLLDRRALQVSESLLPPGSTNPKMATSGKSERANSQAQFLTEQGRVMRERLEQLESGCDQLCRSSRLALREAPGGPESPLRQGFSTADRLLRAAAGIIGGSLQQGIENDPCRLVELLDQRHYCMWQARRALEDFWGPAGPDGGYFAQLAAYYLEESRVAARQILPETIPCWLASEDLEQLAQRRRAAAQSGLIPVTQGITLHEEPYSHHTLQLTPLQGMPTGSATLFMRSSGTTGAEIAMIGAGEAAAEIPRMAIEVGDQRVNPATIEQRFRRTDLESVGSLEAVLRFRGHEWHNPLYITKPGLGQQIVVQRQIPSAPRVTVHGPDSRPLAIMFVFDCSASMKDVVTGDGRSRLDIAVASLPQVLEGILKGVPSGSCRIGLTIYGHRSGHGERGGVLLRTNQQYPDLSGRNQLHPSEDVQIVMGMENVLNQGAIGRIQGMLGSLLPWGETPLYLAIRESLEKELLQVDGTQFARRLVVITDGVNEQTPGSPRGDVMVERHDLEPLLRRLQAENVRIDIFGLALRGREAVTAAVRARRDAKVEELINIATKTNGVYIDARTPAQLIGEIAKALRPGEFALAEPGEKPGDFQPFDSPWTPSDWQGGEREYTVHVRGIGRRINTHNVRLEGGEALEIQVAGNELVHRRYAPGQIVEGRTDDGEFYIRAAIPQRIGGTGVHFPIALQRYPEKLFTARPRYIWAELTPIGNRANPNERTPVFTFYDLQTVPDRPVPVLLLQAATWPELAGQAELRLWFRMDDDVRPVHELPLSPQMEETRFTVAQLPGVQFEVKVETSPDTNNQVVTVWEIHEGSSGAVDLQSARVSVTPQADNLSHRYIPDAQRVQHVFSFQGARAATLQITLRSAITDGAKTLEQPLRIVLPTR